MATRRNAKSGGTVPGDVSRAIFAEAIAGGASAGEAAAEVGICRQSASAWLAEPGVRAMVTTHRNRAAQAHAAKLARLHGKVLTRLESALDDPETPLKSVLEIAKVVLPRVVVEPPESLIEIAVGGVVDDLTDELLSPMDAPCECGEMDECAAHRLDARQPSTVQVDVFPGALVHG